HLEELHTRYGIVSRNGRTLSPLAQAMIARIEHTDRALTERLSGLPSTGFDA
ncbi:hypothetical protein SAMN04244547_04806, partial [Azotobacter vinelandii]